MGKYEEALERAKELHEAGNALTKLQMEIVFPVLKESEDERIICNIKKAAELYWSDEPLNEILSWLEKQKEQKPAEWSEEDKRIMDNCIEYIKASCLDANDLHECTNWLEDLPNRFAQSSWKPSEEQMNNLAYAFTQLKLQQCYAPHVYKSLESLYIDLQKLL